MYQNWRNIRLSELQTFFNRYSKPLFYDCHWCGRIADYSVGRTSNLTDHRYEDRACTTCANEWAKGAGFITALEAAHAPEWVQVLFNADMGLELFTLEAA